MRPPATGSLRSRSCTDTCPGYAAAPRDFGAAAEQRLDFFGYVTGTINHWAQPSLTLKARFIDFLRDVAREIGPLDPEETPCMIDCWDQICLHPMFRSASDAGNQDCRSPQALDETYTPRGIASYGI